MNDRTKHVPDQRTLAFHQKAAEILLEHPERLNDVHETLYNWGKLEGTQAQGWALKWLELINGLTVSEVAKLIVEESEQADFIRKSSPFAGLLSEEERMTIIKKYKYNYE